MCFRPNPQNRDHDDKFSVSKCFNCYTSDPVGDVSARAMFSRREALPLIVNGAGSIAPTVLNGRSGSRGTTRVHIGGILQGGVMLCNGARTKSGHAQETELSAHQILHMAQHCAKRCGLNSDEAADCGMDFLVHILDRAHGPEAGKTDHIASPAWLRRCAINHARDYLRAHLRKHQHECCSLDINCELFLSLSAHSSSAETCFLRSWYIDQIMAAINHLSPVQQQALRGYYISDI